MLTRHGFRRGAWSLTFSCALLLFPTGVHAVRPTPAQLCQSGKIRAAGAEADARLACEATDLDTGANAACVSDAQDRRDRGFGRLEALGGCVTTGDSAAIGSEIDALVAAVLAVLRPGGPAASECTEGQLDAAGRASRKLLRAYAQDERRPDPARLAASLAKAQSKFVLAFARAVARGDCLSTTDVADAYAIVAQAAARLRGQLSPMCGDGVKAPTEACDGSETGVCPDGCLSDCSCDVCPCWTTESLEATFPPGFFDENGRGGAFCRSDDITSVESIDECYVELPGGEPGPSGPRSAAAVIGTAYCSVFSDLDPDDDGFCDELPEIVNLSHEGVATCIDVLLASQLVQECN